MREINAGELSKTLKEHKRWLDTDEDEGEKEGIVGRKRIVGFAISLMATVIFQQAIISTNSFAQDSIPLDFLSGVWISEDYECSWGTFLTEEITITINGNQINAIKTDSGGDRCVPTGSVTFYGSLPTVLPIGKSFPVTLVTGTPGNPACCSCKGYLKLIDYDKFFIKLKWSIFGRTLHFRRVSGFEPVPETPTILPPFSDADNSWNGPVYSTKNSRLFHRHDCDKISSKDGDLITFPSREDAVENGGKSCPDCNP
jgi:hypothetical protein